MIGTKNEKNASKEPKKKKEETRIFRKKGYPGWKKYPKAEKTKRQKKISSLARIKKEAEFQEIYTKGTCLRTKMFTVYYLPQEKPGLGVVARKKEIKGAARRNKAKRILKNCYQEILAEGEINEGKSVLIAKPELLEKKFADIKNELKKCLSRF